MNILNTKEIVLSILRNPKNERTRNSDCVLMANVWSNYFKTQNIDLKTISAHDFLALFSQNELPSFESCTRSRRKLQEKHPELRGSNYKERKEEEAKVIEQIGSTEWLIAVEELYRK